MSVRKITLAKEGSDEVEYLYPKTTADIVEYIDDQSVKDKLDSLDEVEREVRTARKASHDNIIKSNLSERIHEDYEDLKNRIDNITQTDINLFDGILSIEKGGTGASTIYDALFNLSYRTASGAVDLNDLKNKEHLGIWPFDMSNHLTNSPSEATGYLIVIKQSEMTCKQIWLNQGSDKYHEIYTRVYNGSEWKDWVKISNEIDLEELKDYTDTKITDLRKVALVGSDAENQTGWHLVAEGILSGYSNASIMFAVHDTKSYNSGILALDVRCTNNEIVYKNIGWLTRSGFSLEDFAIQTYSNNSWKLFYKVNQRYTI